MTDAQVGTGLGERLAARQSRGFHSSVIDTWTVQVVGQQIGATVRLTLSRREFRREAMHFQPGGTATVEGQEALADEFEAVLQPHVAVGLASQILGSVAALPPEQRRRYGLKDLTVSDASP